MFCTEEAWNKLDMNRLHRMWQYDIQAWLHAGSSKSQVFRVYWGQGSGKVSGEVNIRMQDI